MILICSWFSITLFTKAKADTQRYNILIYLLFVGGKKHVCLDNLSELEQRLGDCMERLFANVSSCVHTLPKSTCSQMNFRPSTRLFTAGVFPTKKKKLKSASFIHWTLHYLLLAFKCYKDFFFRVHPLLHNECAKKITASKLTSKSLFSQCVRAVPSSPWSSSSAPERAWHP